MGQTEEIISSYARIIEDPQTEATQAIAKEHKNADLMHVEFILCHVGTNKNKDKFEKDDLKESYVTAINKPIDWEHTTKNIGVIYESKYVEIDKLDEQGKAAYASIDPLESDFVICKGAVWSEKHPEESKIMKKRHKDGNLMFSMENWFKQAQCSTCNEAFSTIFEYCDHLLTRRDPESTTERIFKNSNFVGAGVVNFPADRGAKSIAIAASTLSSFISSLSISVEDYKNYISNPKENIMRKIEIPEKYSTAHNENIPDDMFADNVNRAFPIDNEANIIASAQVILNDKLEFYDKNEMISVLLRLNEAAVANNVNLSELIVQVEPVEGGTMNEKEFKDAVDKAVAEEIEKRMKDVESGKELNDLKTKTAEQEKAIAKLNEDLKAKDELIAKAAKEAEDKKKEEEKKKKQEERMKKLKEKGFAFEISQPIVENSLGDMSDEAFDQFTKILEEVKQKSEAKKDDTKKDDVVKDSKDNAAVASIGNLSDDKKDPLSIIDEILNIRKKK